MPQRHPTHLLEGFTLIELSIVLVVIGLIIGGVLVGRDMIHAAALRAQISQLEKYNSAVNTFRTKYNDLPGDMLAAKSTQFGLFTETTLAGTPGHQDGDGLIGVNWLDLSGEVYDFWRHLSDANLIDGNLGNILDPTTGKWVGTVQANQFLPSGRLGGRLAILVYTNAGLNYFALTGISSGFNGAYIASTTNLTPIEAYSIDQKLDDGMPNTGRIFAGRVGNAFFTVPTVAPISTANTCTIGAGAGAPTDVYNLVVSTGGEDRSCSLKFSVQW